MPATMLDRLLASADPDQPIPAGMQHAVYDRDHNPHNGSPAWRLARLTQLCPKLRARMIADASGGLLSVLGGRADLTLDEYRQLADGCDDRRRLRLRLAVLANPQPALREVALADLGPSGLGCNSRQDVEALAYAARRHVEVWDAVLEVGGRRVMQQLAVGAGQLDPSRIGQLATALHTRGLVWRTDWRSGERTVSAEWVAALEDLSRAASKVLTYADDPQAALVALQPVVGLCAAAHVGCTVHRTDEQPGDHLALTLPTMQLRSRETPRAQAGALIGAMADVLGDDPGTWALLDELAETHDGTVAELIGTVAALGQLR